MAGVYYWRCKAMGDQRKAWELNMFTAPLVQRSDERWKLSDLRRIAGDSQADAPPSFSSRKALLLVTEHALSRNLMQSRQKKQCFLPIK